MRARAIVLTLSLASAELFAQIDPAELPNTIPIFPLQDVMLFPGVPRPLHIFEPRYREMLLYALATDRIIGMVMLERGHEQNYFGNPPVHAIGCAGVIANVEELSDGRYNIVLHGLTKFRIQDEDQTYAYRIAEVEAISETLTAEDERELRSLRPALLEMFSWIAPDANAPTVDEMPDSELVNGLAQFLPMTPGDRLALLEQDGVLARASALLALRDRAALGH